MKSFIELIYLTASLIAIVAVVPQIKKLLVTKQSDELSLGTWTAWTACQGVALLYAISIHAVAYIVVNILWIVFYAVMVFLIIRYRNKVPEPRLEPLKVPVKVEPGDNR